MAVRSSSLEIKSLDLMMAESIPPRVFISYSWDSEDHKAWVRALAERLTKNGVHARLDQWHIVPGQSLTQFMEAEVSGCDFTLVVCTKEYARKSLARVGGVGYEQQIITGNIVSGKAREHFIPIVRDGDFAAGPECSIPAAFHGTYAIDMRSDANSDFSMESLLRAIFKAPMYCPPDLGEPPIFAVDQEPITIEQEQQEGEEIHLAELDIDGWRLRSGVASHRRWPETFEIPDEQERRGLVSGDIVKLMFDIQVPDDPELGDCSSERMWVIVHERSGPYYIGELNNIPACADEQEHLAVGDRVVFLPEHVISIYSRGGAEVTVDDEDQA
ncbi:toll/interleukin-1 receptor domain-containing protein [Burkholderia cenocepacia]|uniref:toll/interleukin-1 receptor domain-containing protein n=1 Tax=Burkholderia cenocepacia TaxID=95486 RepID=UPI002237C6C6|nr:toll/interleukin-1 receptor domain-containing protein [Burkholderia cenocepacia]MCW5141599.1 toll/interleukin-1 receptor domain-containing protein [Burkholderia cenocepacia]